MTIDSYMMMKLAMVPSIATTMTAIIIINNKIRIMVNILYTTLLFLITRFLSELQFTTLDTALLPQ